MNCQKIGFDAGSRHLLLSMIHCAFVCFPLAASAQEANPAENQATALVEEPHTGTRRALIVCGLTGDEAHHQLFAETVTKLSETLTAHYGFSQDHQRVLFGDEPAESDSAVIKSAVRATKVSLELQAAQLREQLQPADALWVIVLGHSHYDGRTSWLNLPGPDIQHFDFAKLFDGLTAKEQVFLLTMPASGFYIKPLSAKGRVIITATQAHWETNETEFPVEFARLLAAPPETKDFDVDEDGLITWFDVYITVTRQVAQAYLDRELLATEHPLLDDNGDGNGSELQLDFLTPDQGGRLRPRKWSPPKPAPTADGSLSRAIPFPFKPAADEPELR